MFAMQGVGVLPSAAEREDALERDPTGVAAAVWTANREEGAT
jgi:hypothetical protein